METPWTKFYDTNYSRNDSNVASAYSLFSRIALGNKDTIAMSYASSELRFEEALFICNNFADYLSSQGIKKGSVVSIVSPMIPAVVLAFFAINKIGAICSLIDYNSTDSQINYKLSEASTEALVIFTKNASRLGTIIKDTKVKNVIVCSDKDYLGFADRLRMYFYDWKFYGEYTGGIDKNINDVKIISWTEATKPSEKHFEGDFEDSEAKALYLHHSSLLDNKGIEVFTNKSIISACDIINRGYRLDRLSKDSGAALCSMNYAYSGTFVFAFVSMICSKIRLLINPYYQESTFVNAVLFYKPSIIIGYPSTFTSLVEQIIKDKFSRKDLSFIRLIIASGTSFVTTKRKYCEDVFVQHSCNVKISVCYGLAECLSTCSFVPDDFDKNNSIGIPFPGIYVKIIESSTQRELSAGEKGEICICSEGTLCEVLGDPVSSSRVLRKHRDGRIWVHTGDIGHLDEDGFFYFDYVEKRCAKISGVSVSLKQVEDVIKGVYGVFDCCVADYCDEEGDTKLVALVVPIESFMSDNDKLMNLLDSIDRECEMMLSSISRPSEIECRAYLPRTGSGIDYKTITREIIEKRFGENINPN